MPNRNSDLPTLIDAPGIAIPDGVIDARRSFGTRCLAVAMREGGDRPEAVRQLLGAVAGTDAGATPAAEPVAPEDIATCVLVPGLLGDTVRSLVAPMFCARGRLAPHGYDIEVAWVNGRSGSDSNARLLRERVLQLAERGGRAIHLVGYSKGCTDALHLLANHPETHAAVASLTSLGGVVHGTPLATGAPALLKRALAGLPLPGLGRGDGRAIDDLDPDVRARHLKAHPLPDGIHYASLVAAPSPERVSLVLRNSYRRLALIDRHNDSQVIAQDALLPRGELLGVLNADHWALALPIGERHRWIGRLLVTRNDCPRTVLLQALMQHLHNACQ